MATEGPSAGRPGRLWEDRRLSWALVFLGLALIQVLHTPTFLDQVAACSRAMTLQNLRILGLLSALSVLPVCGLWRLAGPLGLPRAFALLYLLFPLAIVAVFLVKPLLDRVRRSPR